METLSAQKFIDWNGDKGHAYLIVGYCPDTLAYFKRLFKEAKKDYPEITEEEVICGKIRNSIRWNSYTIIIFPVTRKNPKYRDWKIDFGY